MVNGVKTTALYRSSEGDGGFLRMASVMRQTAITEAARAIIEDIDFSENQNAIPESQACDEMYISRAKDAYLESSSSHEHADRDHIFSEHEVAEWCRIMSFYAYPLYFRSDEMNAAHLRCSNAPCA